MFIKFDDNTLVSVIEIHNIHVSDKGIAMYVPNLGTPRYEHLNSENILVEQDFICVHSSHPQFKEFLTQLQQHTIFDFTNHDEQIDEDVILSEFFVSDIDEYEVLNGGDNIALYYKECPWDEEEGIMSEVYRMTPAKDHIVYCQPHPLNGLRYVTFVYRQHPNYDILKKHIEFRESFNQLV